MGVKFDRTQEVIKEVERVSRACLTEIGITGKADLMANCPVHKIKPGEKYRGVPGTLRKGHHYRTDFDDKTKRVIFANSVYYAPYVEFKAKGKGGNPWFRATLREDREKFLKIVKKHLAKVEGV